MFSLPHFGAKIHTIQTFQITIVPVPVRKRSLLHIDLEFGDEDSFMYLQQASNLSNTQSFCAARSDFSSHFVSKNGLKSFVLDMTVLY